jgi:hypothetical protein
VTADKSTLSMGSLILPNTYLAEEALSATVSASLIFQSEMRLSTISNAATT